jgi:protein SCO1/2
MRRLGLAALPLLLLAAGCGSGGGSTTTTTTTQPFRLGSTFPAGFIGKKVARISLPDARGGRFDTADLAGKPYVVTFLYTRCPDTCPLIGIELKSALQVLGPRAKGLKVIAVSVDPKHDTPKAIRRWLKAHGEPPAFHYLTSSERVLKPVWKSWYVAPQREGDPRSAHTSIIWLVNRHGRLAGGISAGTALPTDDLVHDLGTLVAQT